MSIKALLKKGNHNLMHAAQAQDQKLKNKKI